jgi:hypothetical protein
MPMLQMMVGKHVVLLWQPFQMYPLMPFSVIHIPTMMSFTIIFMIYKNGKIQIVQLWKVPSFFHLCHLCQCENILNTSNDKKQTHSRLIISGHLSSIQTSNDKRKTHSRLIVSGHLSSIQTSNDKRQTHSRLIVSGHLSSIQTSNDKRQTHSRLIVSGHLSSIQTSNDKRQTHRRLIVSGLLSSIQTSNDKRQTHSRLIVSGHLSSIQTSILSHTRSTCVPSLWQGVWIVYVDTEFTMWYKHENKHLIKLSKTINLPENIYQDSV